MINIKTDVKLPVDKNIYGDCGPLCVQMLILTDLVERLPEFPLSEICSALNKVKMEASIPGNICKFLISLGYEVEYYSVIDWQSCTSDPELSYWEWDDRIKRMIKTLYLNNFQGTFSLEKLRQSAQWLVDNPEIIKPVFLDSPFDLAEILEEGKRIIAYVGADHFVVVTGIDDKFVYLNNPVAEPRAEKMTHRKFFQWWSYGGETLEAIVAKLKK